MYIIGHSSNLLCSPGLGEFLQDSGMQHAMMPQESVRDSGTEDATVIKARICRWHWLLLPFHRHKVACRGICQEIFSPPAPAGAGSLGGVVSRGSQKALTPG